jgi:1-acyl-sn-glycerol-3-phosphate acyltransferase
VDSNKKLLAPTKSKTYQFLLNAYVKPLHRLFYKSIVINGLENIPQNAPVIMALNHQNAAMDALAVACATKRQLVFLARGDIFDNSISASILKFLRIYPVYRMREGIRNLEKNQESFQFSSNVLKNNGVLCIMPEGGQDEGRSLRPLQKGICRIAFKAHEEIGIDNALFIVPVGIDYSDYEHSHSTLTVNFGKPINVAWFYNLEPNRAHVKLRADLTEAMKRQMIHFEKNEHYNNLYKLMKLYSPRLKNIMQTMQIADTSNFAVEKMFSEVFSYMTANNPELFNNLANHTNAYFNALHEMGVNDMDMQQSHTSYPKLLLKCLAALVLAPIAIYGFINNLIAMLLLTLTLRGFADRQFHSTIRFTMGVIAFPLIYIIQTMTFHLFLPINWLVLSYFISLPLSALFVYWYKGFFAHLPLVITLKALTGKKSNGLSLLHQLRNQIIQLTDAFIITHSKVQAAKQ